MIDRWLDEESSFAISVHLVAGIDFRPLQRVGNLIIHDEDIQEKKSMGDKIKYTFKDIDKSYANTTDAFSKRLDSFLDERSEELIESWSLVTTDDLSSLEERYTSACDSIDSLEKRFAEFTNATDAKIEDLDKRLKALEEAEKDLEEAEEVAVEAEKE